MLAIGSLHRAASSRDLLGRDTVPSPARSLLRDRDCHPLLRFLLSSSEHRAERCLLECLEGETGIRERGFTRGFISCLTRVIGALTSFSWFALCPYIDFGGSTHRELVTFTSFSLEQFWLIFFVFLTRAATQSCLKRHSYQKLIEKASKSLREKSELV